MTSTTKTTQTTAERLADAEAKADALRAEARELQAKADAEAKQAKQQEQQDRARFEAERRTAYVENFVKPLRALRSEFEEAVGNGGDYAGAWIKYMGAVHAAAAEEARFTRHHHQVDADQYEAVAKQVNEWQNELQARANRVTGDRPALTPDAEPSGWWTDAIRDLIGDDQPGNNETRVQQINRRLNALAEALGSTARRDLDNMNWIHVQEYAEKPSDLKATLGDPDSRERRTFAQAVQQAVDMHVTAEATRLAGRRGEDFTAWRKKN